MSNVKSAIPQATKSEKREAKSEFALRIRQLLFCYKKVHHTHAHLGEGGNDFISWFCTRYDFCPMLPQPTDAFALCLLFIVAQLRRCAPKVCIVLCLLEVKYSHTLRPLRHAHSPNYFDKFYLNTAHTKRHWDTKFCFSI